MKIQFPTPKNMRLNQFTYQMNYGKKAELVWNILQRRETFCRGQLPPWRVVFESGLSSGTMEKGEFSIHHGPMLSAHGVVTEINDHYRDLQYGYGSYAISYRLIRPYRLQFFKEKDLVRLQFDVYTPAWFAGIWNLLSFIFWPQFFLNLKLISLVKKA
jgi:hypothetical protein